MTKLHVSRADVKSTFRNYKEILSSDIGIPCGLGNQNFLDPNKKKYFVIFRIYYFFFQFSKAKWFLCIFSKKTLFISIPSCKTAV